MFGLGGIVSGALNGAIGSLTGGGGSSNGGGSVTTAGVGSPNSGEAAIGQMADSLNKNLENQTKMNELTQNFELSSNSLKATREAEKKTNTDTKEAATSAFKDDTEIRRKLQMAFEARAQ